MTFEAKFLNLSTDNYKVHLIDPSNTQIKETVELNETENKKIKCPYEKLSIILTNLTNSEEELQFDLPFCELYTIDKDFSQKITIIKSDKQGKRFDGIPTSKASKNTINSSKNSNLKNFGLKTSIENYTSQPSQVNVDKLTFKNTNLNATMYNKVLGLTIVNLPENKKDSKVKFFDNNQDKQHAQSHFNNENTSTGLLINKNQQTSNQIQYYSNNNDYNNLNISNNNTINNLNNYKNFNDFNSTNSLNQNINLNTDINCNKNTDINLKNNSTTDNLSNIQNNSSYVYKSFDGEKFFNDIFKKEYILGISNAATNSQNTSKSHIESTSSNFKYYPGQFDTTINNNANRVTLDTNNFYTNSNQNNFTSKNQMYNNNHQSTYNNLYPSQYHSETYSSKTFEGNRKKYFDLDSDNSKKDINTNYKNDMLNTNKIEKENGISTKYNLNSFDANKFMKELDDPILNSETDSKNFNNINEKDNKVKNEKENNIIFKNSEIVNQQITSKIQSENNQNKDIENLSFKTESINPKGHIFDIIDGNDKNENKTKDISPYSVGTNINTNNYSSNKDYNLINTINSKEKSEDCLKKSLTENDKKSNQNNNSDSEEKLSNVGINTINHSNYYNNTYHSNQSSNFMNDPIRKPYSLENNFNSTSNNSNNRPIDNSIVQNSNPSNESDLINKKDDKSNEKTNQNPTQYQSYNQYQYPSYYNTQTEKNQNAIGTIGKSDNLNENRPNYYNNYQYPSYYSSNYQINSNPTYTYSSNYSNNSGTYTSPYQYPSSYYSTYQYGTNYSYTNYASNDSTLNKNDSSTSNQNYSSSGQTSNTNLIPQQTYYIAYEDYNNNRDNLVKLLPSNWNGRIVIAPHGSNIKTGFSSGASDNNQSNTNNQNSNVPNKNSSDLENLHSSKKIDDETKISSNSSLINENIKDTNSNINKEMNKELNYNEKKEIQNDNELKENTQELNICSVNENKDIYDNKNENLKEKDFIDSSEEKSIKLSEDNIENKGLYDSEKVENLSSFNQAVENNFSSVIVSGSNSKTTENIEAPKKQELESPSIINIENEENFNSAVQDKNNHENFKIFETIADIESPNKLLQEDLQNVSVLTNSLKDEEQIINKINLSPKISTENIQEKELSYFDSKNDKKDNNYISPTSSTNFIDIKHEKNSDGFLDKNTLDNNNKTLSNINNRNSLNSIENDKHTRHSIAGSSKKQNDKLSKNTEIPIPGNLDIETNLLKSKEILNFNLKKINEFYESYKNFEKTIICNIIKNEFKNNEDIIAKKIKNIITIKNNSTKILYIRLSGENKNEEEFQTLQLNSQMTFNRFENKIHKLQISFNKKGKRGPVYNVYAGYNYIIDKNIKLCDNLGKEISLSFSRFLENEGEISINNKYFTFLKRDNLENLKDLSSLVYENYITIVNGSSQNISIRVKSDENSDEDSYTILPLMSLLIQRKADFEFLTEIKNENKNHIQKYKLKSKNIYIYDEKSYLVNLFFSEIIEKQDNSNKIESNKRYRSQALNKISQQLDKQNNEEVYFKFEDYIFDEENLNEFNIENLSEEDIYIRIEKKNEGEDTFFKLNSNEDVWRLREDGLFLMEIVKKDLTSKRYIINTNYCYNIDKNINLIETVSYKLIPNTLEKLSGYKLIYENIDKEINYNADEKLSGFENNEYDSNEIITYFNDIKPKYTRGKKFIDDLFPPKSHIISAINSLNKERNDSNNLHYYQKIDEKILSNISFKRPDEIYKDEKVFLFNENNDDKLNFKSYVASIIYMLNQNPNVIKRNFKTQEYNQDGFYEIYYYENGIRKVMFIDDNFPVMNKNIEDNEFPIFSESKLNEIWPQILEKAYAKYEGGYANITDGNVLSEIYFFTGAISYKYSTKVNDHISVWEILISSSSNSAFVLAGFYDHHEDDQNVKSKLSLFTYTVLSSMEYDKGDEIIRLIKMKNPAAALEWEGGYSNSSEKWTLEIKEYFDADNAFNEDGVFFLSFEEFIDQFDFYVVSFVN